ncbi:hypothetical protein GCM10007939_14960 [Amylibacter marinus]|uniref:Mannose-6-phosphate isomerase type II C-terminal domain-containing protein n=1 Tax=Amylibacter marinus TaxID=1475483 RepID=A0ABQ5VUU5_9RHOB|nr:hypothetical protein [Amylibacter marinus]GLQ35213.1 hypothetical protein GCM10007939_14960 [Amylibacter marinus]
MGTIAAFDQPKSKDPHFALTSRQELTRNERHRVLQVTLPVGAKLPSECHVHVSKRIVVLAGCAAIHSNTQSTTIFEGHDSEIPFGTEHRIENLGKIPLSYLEIRMGTYLDDDDILSQ